mgnify:FL=1
MLFFSPPASKYRKTAPVDESSEEGDSDDDDDDSDDNNEVMNTELSLHDDEAIALKLLSGN